MTIPITPDLRITKLDDLNWAVQERKVPEKGKKAGQETWHNRSYHVSIGQACRNAATGLCDENAVSTLLEYGKNLDASCALVEKRVNEALKG